jgi:hypothetical protein
MRPNTENGVFDLLIVLTRLCLVAAAASSCDRTASRPLADTRDVGGSPGPTQSVSVIQATNKQSQPAFDACSLITREEVEAIQRSSIKDTKSNERSTGALRVSQCFYTAAEFTKSVSLSVTRSDSPGSVDNGPRDFWAHTFSPQPEKENESIKAKGTERESGGEKEIAPPKKIEGIGEEAYWTGTRVGGALYVLSKNVFIRIAIGGTDDEETRISKSRALAEKALPRL